VRLVHVLCFVLITATQIAAECRVPGYREVFTFPNSPTEQIMNISMPLQEFTRTNLVCLAGHFEKLYPGRSVILVNMFISKWAARRSLGILPQEASPVAERALAQMHAQYSFDSSRRENCIEIIPVAGYRTRINLPVADAPRCRLEAEGRCIVALDRPSYPLVAYAEKVSGTVALQATVSRAGTVRNIRVVKVGTEVSSVSPVLVRAAIRNLSTWHFEPAPKQDPLKVTYSYEIGKSVPGGLQVRVSWASSQGVPADIVF